MTTWKKISDTEYQLAGADRDALVRKVGKTWILVREGLPDHDLGRKASFTTAERVIWS